MIQFGKVFSTCESKVTQRKAFLRSYCDWLWKIYWYENSKRRKMCCFPGQSLPSTPKQHQLFKGNALDLVSSERMYYKLKEAKLSPGISTENNWWNLTERWKKNFRNMLEETTMWLFNITTLDHVAKLVKNYLETFWCNKLGRLIHKTLPLLIVLSFYSYEDIKEWVYSWIASKDKELFWISQNVF